MSTWEPTTRGFPFEPLPRTDTSTEVYSRDWQGSKGPTIPGLSVNSHDYLECAYDGDGNIIEVKYFIGGPEGVLVSQLEITWQGGLLQNVRRLNLEVAGNPARSS